MFTALSLRCNILYCDICLCPLSPTTPPSRHITLSLSLSVCLYHQGQIWKKGDLCLNLYHRVIKYYPLSLCLCRSLCVCLCLSLSLSVCLSVCLINAVHGPFISLLFSQAYRRARPVLLFASPSCDFAMITRLPRVKKGANFTSKAEVLNSSLLMAKFSRQQ